LSLFKQLRLLFINFNKHGHINDRYFSSNYRYCSGFWNRKIIEKSNISNLIKMQKRSFIHFKDANLEAENIKKDKILQAKEFIELKSEHEQVIF
jgi:hypothetical protein